MKPKLSQIEHNLDKNLKQFLYFNFLSIKDNTKIFPFTKILFSMELFELRITVRSTLMTDVTVQS